MDSGVSPVIGVMLVLMITVILSAVAGGFLLSMDTSLEEPGPRVATSSEFTASGVGNGGRPYLNITYTATQEQVNGDNIYIVDSDGNRVKWTDVWTTGSTANVGETAHIDGYLSDGALNTPCEGEVYSMVYEENGEVKSLLYKETIKSDTSGAVGC